MATNTSELNLTMHRGTTSVWNRRGWNGSRENAVSRWLIGASGVVLAIEGLRQRTVMGRLLAGLGGTLAWWALTSRRDVIAVRPWVPTVLDQDGGRRVDPVHEASADSFPASDAPAWTPTVGTSVRNQRRG